MLTHTAEHRNPRSTTAVPARTNAAQTPSKVEHSRTQSNTVEQHPLQNGRNTWQTPAKTLQKLSTPNARSPAKHWTSRDPRPLEKNPADTRTPAAATAEGGPKRGLWNRGDPEWWALWDSNPGPSD